MSEDQSSYRQIMKATSLFGGVQVFNILISIIKSKFVAVLLGPAGMGISGLLTSTISLISGITNFGLGTSAVKNIAEANSTGNNERIATVVIVLQRLVWLTGILGTVIALVLSPLLSQLTFGNRSYTVAFIWISITLLFNQLASGQMVVLQGMRKLQHMAKANLIGSVLGVVITIPLYYKLGTDGIVPGIIITALISLLLSWYFSRKIQIYPVKVSRTRTIAEGKGMLYMGLIISLSGFISIGTSYIVRIFIGRYGGLDQVGLYNAGFAIINTYVGLIFTAMGTDYYPRLAAVAHSPKLYSQTINQQAEIALLILAPILIVFLVFINWIVVLLYSSQFLAVNDMIYWAAMGMFFKAASWSVSYLFIAKGASKLFFWNELLTNIYLLGLNLLGYYFYGLTGLGLSFLVTYLAYLLQVYLIANKKYSFTFSRPFILIFSIQISLAIACFLAVKVLPNPYLYILGSIIILISTWYSYKELNKRIGLKSILQDIRKGFSK